MTPCGRARYNLNKKRASNKKGAERRKRSRSTSSSSHQRSTRKQEETCKNCSKNLDHVERALFVEEEVGRIFCSEACISAFFTPEIERLEKEYFRRLSSNDLSGGERDQLAHLRWITLQEPDEIWREKTLAGDYRFTLISEFQPGDRRIWCVCICLFLRGEPSFLYLAFPTRNAAMANLYRKGERVEIVRKNTEQTSMKKKMDDLSQNVNWMDGLADEWTEEEMMRAQLSQERRADDIPLEEFSLYQGCLEETLESPDEVWSIKMSDEDALSLYHFIRHYPDENPGVWYVIIARETEDEEQIEILDAFPTRDIQLVDRYRRGEQEVGILETRSTGRVIH